MPPIHTMRFQSSQLLMAESSDRNKQGRAYNPGRPLSMADRERILQLYEKGHKISHIAKMIGVTHSCVSKIMTRYRRTGSMCPRSYSVGLLMPQSNSLDFIESASECSTSSTSEEWATLEFTAESCTPPAVKETTESHGESSQSQQDTRQLEHEPTAVPLPSRKISGYSIER
ncbi:Helix-turn-helix domain of resolvase [Trichostrongylus colubriformis]|uniref:Helix-turn-helix domain of resolvase n=1 Tax=Trichostrongylus colubriformis TaxID=6319 RepID=A0AAN8G3Y3_TRICO